MNAQERDPIMHKTPDSGPGLEVIQNNEGPERPFFDPKEPLPDVEKIDLEEFRLSPLDSEQKFFTKKEELVRRIIEGARGSLEDAVFKPAYEQTVGNLVQAAFDEDLKSKLSDIMPDLYDTLISRQPRLIKLLDRLKEDKIVDDEKRGEILKATLMTAIQFEETDVVE